MIVFEWQDSEYTAVWDFMRRCGKNIYKRTCSIFYGLLGYFCRSNIKLSDKPGITKLDDQTTKQKPNVAYIIKRHLLIWSRLYVIIQNLVFIKLYIDYMTWFLLCRSQYSIDHSGAALVLSPSSSVLSCRLHLTLAPPETRRSIIFCNIPAAIVVANFLCSQAVSTAYIACLALLPSFSAPV